MKYLWLLFILDFVMGSRHISFEMLILYICQFCQNLRRFFETNLISSIDEKHPYLSRFVNSHHNLLKWQIVHFRLIWCF